nr:hypothetical protein [Tanacetum cinerariifolium]
MENYNNISQDIRDQMNVEAEAVQIILTGIVNDIYSTIDVVLMRVKCGKPLKVYDILKQHQNEVNEIRAERLARTANPLALVAQQQPVYHPQNHPTHCTQNSSTISQQIIRNRGKEIVNSFAPIYDQEPATGTEDDEIANQDNSPRINRGTGYEIQRVVNVVGARENVEQADWKDDTDDEFDDQELEAHYMYMAQIQEVTPDIVDNSENPEQPASVNDPYPDMCYDREQDDQDDIDELAQERDLLASLI